jgi:hypothetical protein
MSPLLSYMKYYNDVRTHLSLAKDTPVSRGVERAGQIRCTGGQSHAKNVIVRGAPKCNILASCCAF